MIMIKIDIRCIYLSKEIGLNAVFEQELSIVCAFKLK